ncbi:purple acid phosphatase family protein [Cellvibrio japonicus]|uniref:Ser/Thr protein phosphatase family protein family n=1 Tax=Cellvibrio japonicus (strain Ueda107) TaxID=498211 RepID=B3PE63_CELJU|nr:metallophosphoesterase family protein [Cellvibrio japonicus]ACE84968.1 Ser/Thr protein phosphatase family protein family [Cellvibrio japonicus Ueda107]QEI12107.1 metallophosphoesterase family protein [Cellvibrio japonicus]QEI15681.1 metallophosphoesterase family protein [Cellvibrio japonicus]QEI19259.1 metallophosphoesterase family protein [Cellvibrio japonicus]
MKNIINRLCALVLFSSLSIVSFCVAMGAFPSAAYANGLPERIILLPTATPAHSQTVTWRTRNAVPTLAEITESTASPALVQRAKQISGISKSHAILTGQTIEKTAGKTFHHRVTFTHLKPATRYAYRVKGEQGWSEWHSFRTAAETFTPYRMIYLGDTQNHIQSLGSRTIRAAFAAAPDARLMLHAGDLTDRAGPEDQLWGEWFAAGNWLFSNIVQLPVVGNHEYRESPGTLPQLKVVWPAHFMLPGNGPESLRDTVYWLDYQGVRFIALDSMIALHSEAAAKQQAQWLEPLLANNPNRWTIVSYHHPLLSGTRAQFTPAIATHWQPLFERYAVDLVLQGDDHIYGRWQPGQGVPVYTISVAGAKQNRVHDKARELMQRVGEDTQWYQVIEFSNERLQYRAWTVEGELYDAVDVIKQPGKPARVESDLADAIPERYCGKPEPASLFPQAIYKPRCREVTELQ